MGKLLDRINEVYVLKNDFDVIGGYCQRYVRLSLEACGFKTPNGLNAWDTYVYSLGIEPLLNFFPVIKGQWSNAELQSYIGKDKFCILLGFYPQSTSFNLAVDTIKTLDKSSYKFRNLQNNLYNLDKIRNIGFNPITHTGIWTKNSYYNVIKQGLINKPSYSFVPVAWIDLTNKINEIDSNL